MGGHGGLAWPDSLGTIESALAALTARVRVHESRYAVLLQSPQPCGERAAALAATARKHADAVLTRCDELAAEADAVATDVGSLTADWLTRCGEWLDTTAEETA